jgi:hypothetical protein
MFVAFQEFTARPQKAALFLTVSRLGENFSDCCVHEATEHGPQNIMPLYCSILKIVRHEQFTDVAPLCVGDQVYDVFDPSDHIYGLR